VVLSNYQWRLSDRRNKSPYMADEQGQSGAEDQNENGGDNLDNNSGTDNQNDNGSQDKSGDNQGQSGGNQGEPSPYEGQKVRAEKAEGARDSYKQRLIDAGLDPETGKPKESGQAPKKDGQDLSALTQQVAQLQQQVVLSDLRAAGHTHPDDQKFILDAARRLGVEPLEAAKDEFVAAKLVKIREARTTKENTPAPGKGSGGTPRKVKTAWDIPDSEWEKERARIFSGRQ
jgi:hypothetical protein